MVVEERHIPRMDRPGEGEKVSSGVPYGVRRVPSDSSDLSDLSDKIAHLSPPYQRKIYYR